jgi:hypothetical protein
MGNLVRNNRTKQVVGCAMLADQPSWQPSCAAGRARTVLQPSTSHQFRGPDAESARDSQNVVEPNVALASFDRAYVGAMETDLRCEHLLGQAVGLA